MQVTETKSEGLSKELEVVVPAGDIDKRVEGRLKEVGKTIRMPGFRPGKVPMDMLKKRYGKAVMGEVLELAVNESSAQALKDKNIRPAMQPKIEVVDFDEGKDLKFKIELETIPEIKVMDIEGLKLEKPVADIDPAKIDEALQAIADNNRESVKIKEDRATKKGDVIVMDFSGRTKDDGVEHAGMQAHGSSLELGSGQFIPGFEDQLIGKKAGDKVEVNVTFPENYGATELAGRDAIFDVEIQEIQERAEATIDDEMAKRVGFDDLKALRDIVEEQIKGEYEQHSRLKLKRALLDLLDEKHQFEAPKAMTDAEFDFISQQVDRERQANPENDEGELNDEEKEELRDIADRRVRLGLVLSEIGNENKVSIADQELQRAVIEEAQKYPGQEKQVFDFYQKNPQALESLRAPLFEDKVVDLIISKAEIKEKTVSVEELTADPDEEDEKPKKKKAKSSSTSAKKKSEKTDDQKEDGTKKKASASKSKKTKKSDK